MKFLIVEDDKDIADFIRRGLMEAGHIADHWPCGQDGLHHLTTGSYDAAVIDRLLPDIDGVTLLRQARAGGNATPVLMLTALSAVAQRVEGLEAGADDYLVKPFAFSELLARLNALARRPALNAAPPNISLGSLAVDRLKRRVTVNGAAVDLLPKEFMLLDFLLLHKGELVTRTMLLEQIWGFHFDPKTNIVETHMSRLRKKLGKAEKHLRTVRGAGYVIDEIR